MILDGWRLAVGMFTAIPVAAPRTVDPPRAGLALLVSPIAFAPWALLVGGVLWLGASLGIAPLPLAVVGVAAMVLGNRGFHLDGLADTADALTSSYDRERSLEVARLGNVGPAGVGAIVLVLMLQIAAGAVVLQHEAGPAVFAITMCLARAACALGATRGIPAARPDGLGSTVAESVPVPATIVVWLLVTLTMALSAALLGLPWWQGAIAAGVALIAVAALLRRAVTRLGGVVGDVLGASIEISAALMLLALAT